MLYLLTYNRDEEYDINRGFLIRAKSEAEAREIANTKYADEGPVWKNYEIVTCQKISPIGISEIIITDFSAG